MLQRALEEGEAPRRRSLMPGSSPSTLDLTDACIRESTVSEQGEGVGCSRLGSWAGLGSWKGVGDHALHPAPHPSRPLPPGRHALLQARSAVGTPRSSSCPTRTTTLATSPWTLVRGFWRGWGERAANLARGRPVPGCACPAPPRRPHRSDAVVHGSPAAGPSQAVL